MYTFKVFNKPNVLNLQFTFWPPPLGASRGGGAKNIFCASHKFRHLDLFLSSPLHPFPTLNTEIPKFYSHQDTTHLPSRRTWDYSFGVAFHLALCILYVYCIACLKVGLGLVLTNWKYTRVYVCIIFIVK